MCSLPPTAPTSSLRRRSLAVWMSSSPATISKDPDRHSSATRSRPSTSVAASSAVTTPAFASAFAYAWLPCTRIHDTVAACLPEAGLLPHQRERARAQSAAQALLGPMIVERDDPEPSVGWQHHGADSAMCSAAAKPPSSGADVPKYRRNRHQQDQRTLMSSAHMRLSKGSDSLNFSISGSVLPVNRPPHSFFVAASGAASAATACQDVSVLSVLGS